MELGAGGGSRHTGFAEERCDRGRRRKTKPVSRIVRSKPLWEFIAVIL